MENMKFCQSCAMPLGETNELYGTNADGSKNEDYCKYCFANGQFTTSVSMEEMIEECMPHMLQAYPDMTEEAARKSMLEYFPKLKRWIQA